MAEDFKAGPISSVLNALRLAMMSVLDWRTLVVWIACSVLATYSGPFGTYKAYSFIQLFGTWLVLLGSGILVAYVLNELCNTFLSKIPPLPRMVVFVALTSLSIGFLVKTLLANVFGHAASITPSWVEMTSYSFVAMMFVILLRKVLVLDASSELGSATEMPPASLPPHSRLAIRLKIPQGIRIVQISAQGHFVDVETCSKTYRTRMRFSDAVAELDGICGITVHRSYWVHRDSIVGWLPRAQKPHILLENDDLVPVSKPYLAKVKAAGLRELSQADLDGISAA